ncbi:MAG TPA: Ig-like domain-containing protein [Symbiobacteriaceae bacterium]|nr:Ig-like domain-containing protein [Symbiobacteriaceae bacterium]
MASRRMRSFERNHYFYGKLMTARDFRTEQEYHREKQWLHTRLVHDFGVVGGLKVRSAGDVSNPWRLLLEPGLAVDSEGREIVVAEPFEFDLSRLMYQYGLNPSEIKKPVYLTLSYRECEAEPVPVYARENAADEGYAPNRVQEGFTLAVTDALPRLEMGIAQEITELVANALKPMDLGAAYRRMGEVGIPPAGVVAMAAAADSEDLLVGGTDATLTLVTSANIAKETVGTTDGNVIGIATAPGVAWVATAASIRMAQWPAGAMPSFTLSWKINEVSAVVANPVIEESKNIAYYLSVVPALDREARQYWRIGRVTSDGSNLEIAQIVDPTKCLAISPDGKTLYYASQSEGRWSILAYDPVTKLPPLEVGLLADEPISLHAGEDENKSFVVAVMAKKCQVFEIGAEQPKELTLPPGFEVSSGAVQGRRVLLAGVDTVAQQPVLQVYDRVTSQRITHMWLAQGSPTALAALPSPSYRLYVGTTQGVEVIDVPVQTNDMYKLLAERSLSLDVTAPKATTLVLASVQLRNGLPVMDEKAATAAEAPDTGTQRVSGIDNVSYRRVMVGTSDLLGVLAGVTAAVAKGTVGPAPSGQFVVEPAVVSHKVENRGYTVRVRALVKDFDGRPAPAGVAVTWSLASEKKNGNLLSDVSFTDPSGVAFVTITDLTPAVTYSITALVGGRGESRDFTGDPINYTYTMDLSVRNLGRQPDGFFTANVVASVKEDGLTAPKDLDVTWEITPGDGALETASTKTDSAGGSANIVRQMALGTTYTIKVTVGNATVPVTITIPSATPTTITITQQPYQWIEGKLACTLKASVKDQWGFLMAGAPAVTWTGATFLDETTDVNQSGLTEATAVGLDTTRSYRITAACGAATADVALMPRNFQMAADLTQENDGQYTVRFQALVVNSQGAPAAGEKVSWVLEGPGSLADLTGTTDGTGFAVVHVTDLPFGASTRLIALGAAGMGAITAQPEIAAMALTAAPYQLQDDGSIARKLTLVVKDSKGKPIPNAGQVTWSGNAGGLPTTAAVNGSGQCELLVTGLVSGSTTGYTVTAACRSSQTSTTFAPKNWTLQKSTPVLVDGLNSYDITTVGAGAGAVGARKAITWAILGPGTLSVTSGVTDDNGLAAVRLSGLAQGETTKVFVLGDEGVGAVQVGSQVASLSIETAGYDTADGSIVRTVTAVVKDRNGNPIAYGGKVDWTSSAVIAAASVNVGVDGKAGNRLLNLAAGTAYTVKAECEGASATITMTPRSFDLVAPTAKVTQQAGGLYTVQFDATVKDKDGNPAGAGKEVRWALAGSGTLSGGTSASNAGSVASVQVSGLPLDQAAKVFVLGDEGYGILDVKPKVQSVQVETASYTGRNNKPAARLTALVKDNFGLTVNKALPIAWTGSGQAILTGADATINPANGIGMVWAEQVVRGAEFVANAACGGVTGQLRATPRDLPVEFKATVLADGSYSVRFDAWGRDAENNPTGAGAVIRFVMSGAGTASSDFAATDDTSKVQVTVTNLLMNQTAKLTFFGDRGWGYQEVMPQPKRFGWVAHNEYIWRNGRVARMIETQVYDVWDQLVPAGTVTWEGSLESPSVDIVHGNATNYVLYQEPGVSHSITVSFAGMVYNTQYTAAKYTMNRPADQTTLQNDGTYRVGLTLTSPVDVSTGTIAWYMVGGGQVETPNSEIVSGQTASAVNGLVRGTTYTVYAVGPTGFGKLVLAPALTVNLTVGDLVLTGANLQRPVTATVRDTFNLIPPNLNVAFATNPSLGAPVSGLNTEGQATASFTVQAGQTYAFTATCEGVSKSVTRGSSIITLDTLGVDNPTNISAYHLRIRASGPAGAALKWSLLGASAGYTPGLEAYTGSFDATGSAANTALYLTGTNTYTIRALSADSFGVLTFQRQPTSVVMSYTKLTTYDFSFSAVVQDIYGGLPGMTVMWHYPNGVSNTTGSLGAGKVGPFTYTDNQYIPHGTMQLEVFGYTPWADLYYDGNGAGAKTTFISPSGGGSSSFAASSFTLTADTLRTLDAQTLSVESVEEPTTDSTLTSFARLASAPTDAEAVLAATVTVRAAGAMRGEGDLYSLKVVATVKSAEGVPAVGIPVAWEGVPAEQIQALAQETDAFGMATALIHGLKPTEVYGITAAAGEGRDTLFVDQSLAPTYWLYVTPVPVDETGEAGFAIDLRDPEGLPVKGATVRYDIRGGGESKAGKLITSRALEPKPVVVMGLKPGVAYEIEVSGKDLFATLSYQP